MIKFLTPFEKISKMNRTLILIGWLLLLIVIWFVATAGEKHLFPSPSQVLTGFQDLYREGLVTKKVLDTLCELLELTGLEVN